MFEIKKDRIKSRLEKSFRSILDKGADAVVETISKKISSAAKFKDRARAIQQASLNTN